MAKSHYKKFKYHIIEVLKNGFLKNGKYKDFANPKEMRNCCSDELTSTRRLTESIDDGNMIIIVIDSDLNKMIELFDKSMSIFLIKCTISGLDAQQSNVMLLIWRGTTENNLAAERGITDKQMNEILNKIYGILNVADFFQLKFMVDRFISVHPNTAA